MSCFIVFGSRNTARSNSHDSLGSLLSCLLHCLPNRRADEKISTGRRDRLFVIMHIQSNPSV